MFFMQGAKSAKIGRMSSLNPIFGIILLLKSAQLRVGLDRWLSEGCERWKNADRDREIPDFTVPSRFDQIEDRSGNVDLHRCWGIVMRHVAGSPMCLARRRPVSSAEWLAGRVEWRSFR